MKKLILIATVLGLISGCVSTAEKKSTEQAYLIIDVKGDSSIRDLVLDTVVSSVEKSMDSLTVSRGIPPQELPEKATRFKLTSPFANSSFGALMQSQGAMLKFPSCQDPILTMKSDDNDQDWGESTSFFVCVVQYQEGYHVDVYTTFEQSSGGLSVDALSQSLARSIVGDTSQIIPRTMKGIESDLAGENLETKIVDQYIPKKWKGAFLDETADATGKSTSL
ncbi:hypothetical protein BCU84_02655 [Shewanella sp. 10N.286.51.B7]|uniref:hypothetical protein n=1 Tax=Shewanella sp. 10N.286.51.B7 TaxID=1880836 RepID=UPI000C82C580|nr:hypothetical protein [Shewanella sp. 10N.286.51.B7]PMG71613.1 hypothetical protein BCU84_02655 [Shewanella sp. 10N.286.51.B7]